MNDMAHLRNGFLLVGRWIKTQSKRGYCNFCLWVYLLVGIIFFGFTGIWMECVHSGHKFEAYDPWICAVGALGPAIAGTTCLDLVFGENDARYRRAFAILSCVLVTFLSWVAFFCQWRWLAFLVLTLACALWWVVNANNPHLQEETSYEDPVGATSEEVTGEEGGFDL